MLCEWRLNSMTNADAAMSLHDVGFPSAISLLGTYAGQRSDLTEWLRGAQINRDRNMRLQYLAGMALNTSQENAIYQDMLRYLRYPEELFVASPSDRKELERILRAK